jgi:hypothetical protein
VFGNVVRATDTHRTNSNVAIKIIRNNDMMWAWQGGQFVGHLCTF